MTAGALTATLREPRRRRFPLSRLQGLVGVAIAIGLFELATLTGVLPEQHFPLITSDLATLVAQFDEGSFWTQVGRTVEGWAAGFGIAAVVGIVLGILIGSSDALHAATRVIVEFLRPIPSVALIPLAVLVQAIYCVRDVDPVATDTARAFGYGRVARMRSVTLPSAVPYIVPGLRIASATALILAVTAELVIGAPGLGQGINVARSGGDFELMYALMIATGLLGWLLNVAFIALERRLLHWHPSQRAGEVAP